LLLAVSEVGSLKWIEVSVLVLAGGLFVWWQLRDVRQAQEQSRQQRQSRDEADAVAADESPQPPPANDRNEGPRP
jgi:uncharacterized protein HemX